MEIEFIDNISQDTDNCDDKLIQRHISIFELFCEGRRYDEIAKHFNVSKSTVYNDIKWCRDKLSNGFPEETFDDMIFDTVRRRAILWSRFKKLSSVNYSTSQLVNVSKHILELDKKILEWKSIAKNTMKIEHSIDNDDLDSILIKLDDCLRKKSPEEIDALLAKEIAEDEKNNRQ